jgi:hypothetical protein
MARTGTPETIARGGSPGPPPPVLVVGMHNSGTTLLARILDRGGLFLGGDGAHGENRFFRDEVNEGLVLGTGDRWSRLPIPSPEEVLSHVDAARALVATRWLERYRDLGYDGHSPWGFKDPRTCITLPLWLVLFPRAKVLHIARNPDDVAASLCRRRKRDVGVLRDFIHWRQLCLAYSGRVRGVAEGLAGRYLEIAYEGLCREPERVLPGAFAFAGIEWNEAVRDFAVAEVDPSRIGSAARGSLAWRWETLVRAIRGRR